ncbi:MAG: AMP-binding protein [Christensenellaceae bacterium]|jgi:long-chain acyl-CoA synthetase|nr:AMP-binding protein [Christensenellaceae bacterium]
MEIKFKDFLKSLNKYSEGIAVKELNDKSKVSSHTYGDLINDVERLCNVLSDSELWQKKIAIIARNSYNWIKTFFAITCLGAVVIPIDINISIHEIINICNQGEINYIFHSDLETDYIKEISEKTSTEIIKFISVKDDEKNAQLNNFKEIGSDDVSVILYTSGTTSEPKAVGLSSRNILSVVYSAKEKRLSNNWTVLSILPYSHIYALTCDLLFSLENGDTIILNDELTNVFTNMYRFSPNLMYVVPEFIEKAYKLIMTYIKQCGALMWFNFTKALSKILLLFKIDIRRFLFRKIIRKLGNIEVFISGGAYLMPKYIHFFNEIGIKILNGYGMTECAPLITIQNIRDKVNINSVGTPISCCEIMIKKEGKSDTGEIYVKGDNVMLGNYIGDNKLKIIDVFENNWIKTGDIGRIDKDGSLYLKGRKKNVIVLKNGYNVYPEELEGFFRQSNIIDNITIKLDNNEITAIIKPAPEIIEHYDQQECKRTIDEEVQRLNNKISAHMRVTQTRIIYNDRTNI